MRLKLGLLVIGLCCALGRVASQAPPGDGPASDSPPLEEALIQVNGSERLQWRQTGDTTTMRFRAYVDGHALWLDDVRCARASGAAQCVAPLPSMTTGRHEVVLSTTSLLTHAESARAAALWVYQLAPPDPRPSSAPHVVTSQALTVMDVDGRRFAADTVASGLSHATALRWLPDGRVLFSDVSGAIRSVRPGEEVITALAPQPDLGLEPDGPAGLAPHPEFSRTRFVYSAWLTRRSDDEVVLRLVRLRDVEGTLGEPATLHEALLRTLDGSPPTGTTGPALAFGPDGLLYLALPPGLAFVLEPGASTPLPVMLRLTEEGRPATHRPPLTGITHTPLGFDWHPATGALWVMTFDRGVMLTSVESTQAFGPVGPIQSGRRSTDVGLKRGRLLFAREGGTGGPGRAYVALPGLPLSAIGIGVDSELKPLFTALDTRMSDVTYGGPGTFFVVAAGVTPQSDAILRLRPLVP